MYLTPHQKKQIRTIVILIIGIPLTIFGAYKGVQYFTQAGVEATPQDVVVSNLTTNSLTVSWITEKPSDGYVVPILNGKEQNPVTDKRGNGKRLTHYVEIKSLEPDTKYSFEIISDSKKYKDTDGKSFEFTTAPISTSTPIPNPIHGSVLGAKGDDVIIYVMLKSKSAYPVSTTIPSGGNWIVDLSSFREVSDKTLVSITDDTELVLIAKSGNKEGAVIEGKYSALFDSNGKLNELYTLDISETSDLISQFPEESNYNVTEVDDDTDEHTDENTDENDSTPDIIDEEEEEEEEEDTPTGNRVIKHDLQWINLITGGESLSGLDYGEETVQVTNLTDTSFTVVWRSQQKEEGYIEYGESETTLTEEVTDSRDGLTSKGDYYSHSVDIDRLSPETTYYFVIHSGDEDIDSSGEPFTVETFSTLSSPPPFDTKTGTLSGSSTLSDWILIANLEDQDESGTLGSSKYISTIPDENGSWILTIGDARSSEGDQYFTYSSSDTLEMYVLGNSTKTFSFDLSGNEAELSLSSLSSYGNQKVELLTDYGILPL